MMVIVFKKKIITIGVLRTNKSRSKVRYSIREAELEVVKVWWMVLIMKANWKLAAVNGIK